MKNKIRAKLLEAHSSVICGIDSSKASILLEEMFKSEISTILDSIEDIWIGDSWDRADLTAAIQHLRDKYKLYD